MVGLTGTLMGFPSRVGVPLPFTTGSKQSLHRPLSFSHCPWMNPNLLHSRMIFWQAALFSAAAWFCTGRFRDGTAVVCALARLAVMVATRKVPAIKIRVVVRITLLLEVRDSSGYESTLCRGFAPLSAMRSGNLCSGAIRLWRLSRKRQKKEAKQCNNGAGTNAGRRKGRDATARPETCGSTFTVVRV